MNIAYVTVALSLGAATPLPAAMPQQVAPSPAPMAQTAPATDPTAVSTDLTDKEKTALDRCKAMPYYQQQQSSKCLGLMKKAGIKSVAPEQPRQ